MNIHDNLAKYEGSFAYYGFPVIPKLLDNDFFILEFPEGYVDMKKVAEQLESDFGGKVMEMTEKEIRIAYDRKKLAVAMFNYFLKFPQYQK